MSVKKALCLLLILTLLFTLCGCASQPARRGTGPLQIVTTVFPACDFASAIAGEHATVTLIVPPGAELHSFEPTPQDLLLIRDSALFICNGGESEAWVEELLEGGEGARETLVMLECVDALEEEQREGMQAIHEEEEEDGEDEGPEYDEHVWTSPVNAQRICRAIADRLAEIDPANAADYAARCEACCAELGELDASFRALVDGAARRTVVFADRFPARYFVEEYGLTYYAAFPGCAEDTEPAAGTVAFLIDRVREEELPAVFFIELSNEKMADVICEDTGCRKLLFHTCHNLTAAQFKEGASYLGLMRGNLDSLREALN